MRNEYIKPQVEVLDECMELLFQEESIFFDNDRPPGGVDDGIGVDVGPGTVDPEDALARPGYSVWDE